MSEIPPNDQGEFTEQERLALDAWQAPEPRVDLAAAVLARMAESPAERPSRRGLRLVFRALLVMAAVAMAWRSFRTQGLPASGALVAEQRTTVSLESRGVAVAEAGAELRWNVDADGAAAVSQVAGDVFYRVEPGASFAVATSVGEVTVTGTCFRVQVEASKGLPGSNLGHFGRDVDRWQGANPEEYWWYSDGLATPPAVRSARRTWLGYFPADPKEGEMRSGTKMAGSAMAGAIATAIVLVTVYEGRVAVASDGRTATVEPGRRATLAAGKAPVVEDARPSAPTVVTVATPAQAAPTPNVPALPAPAPLPSPKCDAAVADDLARQKAANTVLNGKVAALEADLKKAQRVADKYRTFDLAPDTLQDMAKRCELRWDHPAIRVGEKPTVDDEAVATAKLSDEEKAAVTEELTKFNTDTLTELRRIYTEVTGDDQVGSLAPEAMFAEINDKSDRTEIRLTFEKLAAERAGLAQAPAEGAEMPNLERAYRLLTTAGDHLEAVMAARIGAEKAHALREYRNGWGSASRSTYGCPERTP